MSARSEMRRYWKEYMKKTGVYISFPDYVSMALRTYGNANTHLEE